MVRVVMFDVGDTLVDAELRPFPHVREAVAAIASFRTGDDDEPLATCIVSDFRLVSPPITAAKVRPVMAEYLAILEPTGLLNLFEPVARRVTLSTHAGVLKPDRRVFETALRRLRSKASLDHCLLVTENVAHARAAIDELGMQALVFRPPAGTTIGFDDWSQAAALVARLVDGPADNVSAATRVYLGAREIEAGDVTPGADASTLHVSGRSWRALNVPGEPDLDGVMVPIPVRGELRRGAHGELVGHLGEPSDEEVAEATSLVKSLAAHRQIEGRTDGQVGAATHAIEADASGRRRLVRKRFTAV